ncbi:MAG: hypothetical protein CFH06_01484 [Alphaproteobacteria bacterium MarineAlpha3_Bin5]|nr:MAG: hypothetical protein CFH06_01484 [Alphaproteobacteria bacterium MarineAlpha3_Bin5]
MILFIGLMISFDIYMYTYFNVSLPTFSQNGARELLKVNCFKRNEIILSYRWKPLRDRGIASQKHPKMIRFFLRLFKRQQSEKLLDSKRTNMNIFKATLVAFTVLFTVLTAADAEINESRAK